MPFEQSVIYTLAHTYGNTRAIITFVDVVRHRQSNNMYNGAATLFFLLQFRYARIAWKKKMKRQYFFFRQFAYKLSL